MEIIKLLDLFEHAGEIYNAMDSEDSVDMVRAADRVISKLNIKDICILNKKSSKKSKEFRDLGNDFYSSGKNGEALACYNKAIAYALPGTLEMLLAVGNRSAVLFTMRSFSCLSDIKFCLTKSCPPGLAKKLNKRMLEARAFVDEDLVHDFMNFGNEFTSTFFTKKFVRNEHVNSASSDVAFIKSNGVQQITAKRKISPGKVVAIEPAFITSNSNGYNFQSCYYCNKLLFNPSPCTECCYAMFCTEGCQKLCMSDYHSIECQIVDLLEKIYNDPKNRLTIRAAIKLSLKLGWDGFIAASENIGSSRMKVASTREAYSVEEPLSMLSYDDSQELVEGRMFNGSLICAMVLKHLNEVPNYFPKEGAKRAAAKKAMSKIMFHLYVHFSNTVYFTNTAYVHKSETCKVAQKVMGWFSMTSKLKHSCQPNMLIVGLNDHIALVSLRTIEKGEELTISFFDHFLTYNISGCSFPANFRATHLFMRTKKMCSCNVCMEEWSFSDLTHEPMTNRQAELQKRFLSVNDFCLASEGFQLACEILDTFSVKSKQYHEAYITLKQFLYLCHWMQSRNRCYSEEEVDICL